MATGIFSAGCTLGAYRVIRELGRGGMGVVYEVEHRRLKVRRALKVFAVDSENLDLHRARFLSECKLLSALDHPRIVRVHEFDVEAASGLPYFVMDLVLSGDGRLCTLEDERRAGMSEGRVAEILRDLAEGLAYIHAQGIVHGDVKLENVLIGPDGHAVLTDFGISRIFNAALRERLDIALTLPQETAVLGNLGSAYYRAPELDAKDGVRPTPASDRWALGIALYRLLTGVWFEDDNRAACLRLLDDYDRDWRAVVESLCDRDPRARRLPDASSPQKRKPLGRQVRWIVGGLAAGLIAAGAVLWFFPADTASVEPSSSTPARNRAAGDAAADFPRVTVVSRERRAAVRKAEAAFFHRELYAPVARALAGEPAADRERWAGVLQTAQDMEYGLGGGRLRAYREFVGRGALEAYRQGCAYPVPIAYAHASWFKSAEERQACHARLFAAWSAEERWNLISRYVYLSFLAATNWTPADGVDVAALQQQELRRVLRETPLSADELGAMFDLVLGTARTLPCELVDALARAGCRLDPWLARMLRAFGEISAGVKESVLLPEAKERALRLLEEAYALRPDLPQSTGLALGVCYGDRERMTLWERRAQASRPDYLLALEQYLRGLRPQWGGSLEEMAAYCLRLACEKQFETIVPIYAYECLVREVFIEEGGIETDAGKFPNVDRFVEHARIVFLPYFEGYRTSGLRSRASLVERAHLCAAMVDLAWRLEREDDLLYWYDRMMELGMPFVETDFYEAFLRFEPYVPVLRRLGGTRRHEFLQGLHAYYSGGAQAAIARLSVLAREEGLERLALACGLFRLGTSDLRPLLERRDADARRVFSLDFTRKGRHHLVFRVGLRARTARNDTDFSWRLSAWGRDGSRAQVEFRCVRAPSGAEEGVLVWPDAQPECAFEIEVVGNIVRLMQNGRLLSERSLPDRLSLTHQSLVEGDIASSVEIEKFELEILDEK